MAKKKAPIDHVRVFFVVVIVVLGLSFFVFYQDNLEKASFIANQTTIIRNLDTIVVGQNNTINILNTDKANLENNVSFLTSEVDTKTKQISEINRLLGQVEVNLEVTKTEVKELTPTVKNYFAVGVKGDSTGVVIPMDVKISKGTGILSVNIKGVDLQSSASASVRTASQIASTKTGIDISKKDITVSFVNNDKELIVLDGPSAGAAITVTIIAALQNKNLDNNSMMTGTIEENGAIGKVAGVSAKAQAAKNFGKTKFYVPDGEDVTVSGLIVREVSNINEAIDLIIQ